MKKINIFVAIAAASMAMVSCSKENSEITPSETVSVTFSASSSETKTAFGAQEGSKYPVLWTANDSKVSVSNNFASSKDATVEVSEDFKTAVFTATITAGESANVISVVSPSSAMISAKSTDNTLQLSVPASQTPLENSVDEAAMILYGYVDAGADLPEHIDMDMHHFTAYGCFSFSNLDLGTDNTIKSVSIVADADIANRFYLNPATGAVTVNSGAKSISLATSRSENIWFAVAPATVSSLKFTVSTDKGDYIKTVSLSKSFVSGKVAKFTVDMTGIKPATAKVYTLLTDASELEEGYEVVITASSTSFALSSTQNNNNRADAKATFSEDRSTLDDNDAFEVFVIEPGTKTGTWGLLATKTKGYIYAASSSNNYMRTQDDLDDNASWTISVASGVASITANGTNSRKVLRYNEASKCFSCYAPDSQKPVSIYYYASQKKTALATPANLKVTDYTVSWDAVSNAGSYEVKIGSEDAVTVTSTSYTYEHDGYFNVSVTAVPSDSETYKKSSAATLSNAQFGKGLTSETIAQIKAKIPTDNSTTSFKAILEGAVVTYVTSDKKNVYLEDASGAVLFYDNAAGNNFKAGDKIVGLVNITAKTYNALRELTALDVTEATVTSGAAIPSTTLSVSELVANMDKYESARISLYGKYDKTNGKMVDINDNSISIKINKNTGISSIDDGTEAHYPSYPLMYNTNQQINCYEAPTDITITTVISCATSLKVNIGGDAKSLGLSSNSKAPFSFEYDKSILSVDAGGNVKALATASKCTTSITVKQAVYENYTAAEATCSVVVDEAGKSLTIDFEKVTDSYTDFKFDNMTSQLDKITAHGGNYHGTTGGKSTASITTVKKVAKPKSIDFFISKCSSNTKDANWIIQVSSDNSSWTNVSTTQGSGMTQGTWIEVSQSLTAYTDVYVRISYSGSTAVRAIDDVVIEYE